MAGRWVVLLCCFGFFTGCSGGKAASGLKKSAAADLRCSTRDISVEELTKAKGVRTYLVTGCGLTATYEVQGKERPRMLGPISQAPVAPMAPPPSAPVAPPPPPPFVASAPPPAPTWSAMPAAAGAQAACDGLMMSSERDQCKQALSGHTVQSEAASVCASILMSSDRLACLLGARDKVYSGLEVSQCSSKVMGSDKRDCIATRGALPPPPAPAPTQAFQAPFSTAGAPARATSGNSNASMRCCINKRAYACGSPEALDRCAGAFSRCLVECGLSCAESCMKSHPPDPSACSRDSSLDGDC